MLIEIDFPAFNPRRFGKPWGAKITFSGAKPEFDFCGHWDGDNVVIEANADDVVCYGQKDHRGNRTSKHFAIVQADGTLDDVSEATARKHALSTATGA